MKPFESIETSAVHCESNRTFYSGLHLCCQCFCMSLYLNQLWLRINSLRNCLWRVHGCSNASVYQIVATSTEMNVHCKLYGNLWKFQAMFYDGWKFKKKKWKSIYLYRTPLSGTHLQVVECVNDYLCRHLFLKFHLQVTTTKCVAGVFFLKKTCTNDGKIGHGQISKHSS